MRTPVLVLLVFFSCACVATEIETLESLVANPEDRSLLFELGIAYHNAGVRGDKVKAIKLFEKLIRDEEEGLATSYLGSSHLLKARDDWNPFGKLSNLGKGFEYLDRAVKYHGDNIMVLVIRANAYINIPGIFGKLDTSIADFQKIIQLYSQDTVVDDILLNSRLKLGEAFVKKGDNDK
ncbi:MAG TPA: tetratricopeptide repeat protein, partial [Mesotoga infera]|nr:tetratricopeptide repeat protein [Mesotoga infera]